MKIPAFIFYGIRYIHNALLLLLIALYKFLILFQGVFINHIMREVMFCFLYIEIIANTMGNLLGGNVANSKWSIEGLGRKIE